MLAQRPESDVRRSWTILRVAAAVYLALSAILMAGAMVGILRSTDLPPTAFRSHLITMPLWIVIAGCAVSVASMAARAGTAGVAIGWLMAPFLIAFLKAGVGISHGVENALQFLAPPFDAVILLPAVLRGEIPEQAALRIAQLVSFPLLCFVCCAGGFACSPDPTRCGSNSPPITPFRRPALAMPARIAIAGSGSGDGSRPATRVGSGPRHRRSSRRSDPCRCRS